ncbi:MAG: YARHG domain-containing protein [Lachnospiraceae bacterium]
MFCRKCGKEIKEGQKFCPYCGADLRTGQNSQAPRQNIPNQPQMTQNPVNQSNQPQMMQNPMNQPIQPQMAQNPMNQPMRKKKTGKKVGIIVAVVIALAAIAAAVAVFVLKQKDGKKELPDEEKNAVVSNSEEQALSDTVETKAQDKSDDSEALLEEKLQEILKEQGSLKGKSCDMKTCHGSKASYEDSGVIGAIIHDISGDGVEDLVVVEAEDGFESVYADIYTVEDKEVVQKAKELDLGTAYCMEDEIFSVYLKETKAGWNLVSNGWSGVHRLGDGVGQKLYAYVCDEHVYTKAAEYEYAGSDSMPEDITHGLNEAKKAGLQNVTEAIGTPFILQDQDVVLIAGIWNDIQDVTYEKYANTTGKKYGQINVEELTTDRGKLDRDAAEKFLKSAKKSQDQAGESGTENTTVTPGSSDSVTGVDILPDSSTRRLTAADLEKIKDNPTMLRYARNEIYARHGRKFADETLQAYFMTKPWYSPTIEPEDFSDDLLSQIEKDNLEFIHSYEENE